MKYLSIVIPVYNEEGNIVPLYSNLKKDLNSINNYEIILINDGSTDATLKKLKEIKDESVNIVSFEENKGLSSALTAGFKAAKGKFVITMDGDLQNDSSDIRKLLSKLDEGYDVVCGWRYIRKDSFLIKCLPSRSFNLILALMFNLNIHDSSCTLRAYRRSAVIALGLLKKGDHRFIPILLSKKGFKISELKVKHNARKSGRAKYNSPSRFIQGLKTLICLKLKG